ncbi:DUF4013 domain-containing protein [Methanobacterium sp. SMA-27]|uniref:DUF4013 domain-containing protein n=1 Tax=Methanobacterium sp. SMA-27 TaxID=1495336 RepID=UPI00064EF748|nr:DUF4013 domain-containing protein [Methanobacterium sp. SMA-27]
MNIGEIISDSIKYPTSDWTKVLILGVIFLISVLILPIFLAYGYMFRIIKATIAGIDELPEFDAIGDMFIDGLKIFVVGIVYAIPVIIIGLIVSLIFGPASATTSTSISAGMFWALIIGNIIYVIIGLIVGLIAIIGIANMAYYDGDLGAAFRFSEILDYISRIGWGKYLAIYIIVALLSFVIYFIAIIVGILLIVVGLVITLPLAFAFISMFGSRAVALLFTEAVIEVPETPTEPEPLE